MWSDFARNPLCIAQIEGSPPWENSSEFVLFQGNTPITGIVVRYSYGGSMNPVSMLVDLLLHVHIFCVCKPIRIDAYTWICWWINIHVHIYIYIYIFYNYTYNYTKCQYIETYIHILHACMQGCMHPQMHTCVHPSMRRWVHAYIRTYIQTHFTSTFASTSTFIPHKCTYLKQF